MQSHKGNEHVPKKWNTLCMIHAYCKVFAEQLLVQEYAYSRNRLDVNLLQTPSSFS